jgi:PAS domain S-box-containing protein
VSARTAVALWTLALVAGVYAFFLAVTSPHADEVTVRSVLSTVAGLAFVGSGLVLRMRRPDTRMGLLMVTAGFAWLLPSLAQAGWAVPFTIGMGLNDAAWAFFAWVLLAYPTGRLEGLAPKVLVAGAFMLGLVLRPIWILFTDLDRVHPEGPGNAFLVDDRPAVSSALSHVIEGLALALIVGAIAVLVQRWRAASPPLRRTLAPPFLAFGVTISLLAGAVVLQVIDLWASWIFYWAALVALLFVPLSFAVGLLQTRLARAGVGRLLVELDDVAEAEDLRDALARALGDPSLELAFWLPEQRTFVDVEGSPVDPPINGNGTRLATVVERAGEPVAALVHDASLRSDPDLLEAVSAAAGLSLENERRLTALMRSEARLRGLVEALPDLMFRLSRDGTYLDVQAPEAALLAQPRERLLGRSAREVLPEEVAERLLDAIARLNAPGDVESIEYSLPLQGGERHFEARLSPIGPEEVVLIVRDISERTRHELERSGLQDQLRARLLDLDRERELNRAVVQASPSFFCVLDDGGVIVRFNRALERATGIEDGPEVRGRSFWEVFPIPEHVERVREAIATACRTSRESAEREDCWVAAAGGHIDVAWSLTPLAEGDGTRFLVTGIDITERARHEAELRRSRARIVEAASAERRRLERNLHDGAQQRLVSLSLSLRLAQAKVTKDPEEAERQLNSASDELAHALEELRELARGIHPAVLTDRGLEPALQALVTRAPVPVTLAEAPEERLPEPVEAAAYYVVAEALTNVAKYSEASAATVRISRVNGNAVVEVADDGVGGADPGSGSGLRGLADRVEALDGRLEIRSARGSGTTVRAEIPLG